MLFFVLKYFLPVQKSADMSRGWFGPQYIVHSSGADGVFNVEGGGGGVRMTRGSASAASFYGSFARTQPFDERLVA